MSSFVTRSEKIFSAVKIPYIGFCKSNFQINPKICTCRKIRIMTRYEIRYLGFCKMSLQIAFKTTFNALNSLSNVEITFKIIFKPQNHFQSLNSLSSNKKPPKLPLERLFLYFRYQISIRYVADQFKRQLPQFYVRRNQFYPHIVPDMITFARRLPD